MNTTRYTVRDRAWQWLAGAIHAVECGCDDTEPDESSKELADAILLTPGLQILQEYQGLPVIVLPPETRDGGA